MLDKRIKFDERWDRDDGTTVLWFIAPKEMLPREYSDAELMDISIECPTNNISADYAYVECSPTKYDKKDGCYVDYDWREIGLPYEEIEALIELAKESEMM